jgi:transposase
MPPGAVLLFEDETVLRLLPVLRRAWALRGEQAKIGITGRNAKRVLFGTITLRTGHRILHRAPNMRQEHFHVFLHRLRRSYPGHPIWLLLDEAPCHTAGKSQALARQLDIVLVWLPTQCSELNAMDQLWRELKGKISANYQYSTIDEHAAYAEAWVRALTCTQALRKASILAKTFWLKSFFK